jgi:hypothetical protein
LHTTDKLIEDSWLVGSDVSMEGFEC